MTTMRVFILTHSCAYCFPNPRSVQLISQQPAFDGAVEQNEAARRLESDIFGQFQISGQDKTGPAAATLLHDVADTAVEFLQLLLVTQALAVGWIDDHHPPLPLGPELLQGGMKEVQLFPEAGVVGIAPGQLQRAAVLVIAVDQAER